MKKFFVLALVVVLTIATYATHAYAGEDISIIIEGTVYEFQRPITPFIWVELYIEDLTDYDYHLGTYTDQGGKFDFNTTVSYDPFFHFTGREAKITISYDKRRGEYKFLINEDVVITEVEIHLELVPPFLTTTVKYHQGINLVSLPVDPCGSFWLSDLCTLIGPAVQMIIWECYGKFIEFQPRYGFHALNNHRVKCGEGYILVLKEDTTVTYKGLPWSNAAPPILEKQVIYQYFLKLVAQEKTQLLQNFPNPFNPETWIPFKLKESSDTSITIYDVHGRVVRKLDLGYIPAGIYQTKAKSAYWDGTNDMGERVASGIYFYHLEAGKFSASRKMVILK